MMDHLKRNSKEGKQSLSRRSFLRSASLAAVSAVALPASFSPIAILTKKAKAQPPNLDPFRVIVVRDEAAHQGSQINGGITRVMMDEAIRRYTQTYEVGDAYGAIFPGISQSSVIGIKVNCINQDLSTHPAVVDALVSGLQKMRIGGMPFPANNIIIWDRYSSELEASGYTLNTGSTGVRCFGTDEVGYNTNITLSCAGYTQHPSRILTDYIDYHINFAVMKNAGEAGLTMTLKNNYGCIDAPYNLHATNCNPYIPAVNQQLRDVLELQETLFIVDAIFGSWYGGPMGPPNMIYDGIILGQDRVAVDTIGRCILEEYNCPSLTNSVHVDTAALPPYSLGTNNLEEIERIDVMNPSSAVQDLRMATTGQNVKLGWTTPEYTGYFNINRSTDSNFTSFEQIAHIRANQYIDFQAINQSRKFFYQVLKSW